MIPTMPSPRSPVWGCMADGTMRLDRFLWWVRIAKSRTLAQGIAADGHLRLDGRPVDRAHAAVRIGNVLTFAAHGRVRVIRVVALPLRRGPAAEAQRCYEELTDAAAGGGRCERLAASADRLTTPGTGHSSKAFAPSRGRKGAFQ